MSAAHSRPGRPGRAIVLDDLTDPPARTALGGLLARSESADFAITRLRLAAIDFRDRDLAAIRKCRVVLGRLDFEALTDAAEATARTPAAAANVAVLRRFIATGRLELRSAGVRRWRPDFCILHGRRLRRFTRTGSLSLIGHLGIGPATDRGPDLTCILAGDDGVRRAAHAFQRLWSDSHDVLDVVTETLDQHAKP